MKLRSCIAWVTGVTVLAVSTVCAVQAQTVPSSDITEARPNLLDATALSILPRLHTASVIFSDITDAVPNKFFDAATTAPDPLNPNKLIIGLKGIHLSRDTL